MNRRPLIALSVVAAVLLAVGLIAIAADDTDTAAPATTTTTVPSSTTGGSTGSTGSTESTAVSPTSSTGPVSTTTVVAPAETTTPQTDVAPTTDATPTTPAPPTTVDPDVEPSPSPSRDGLPRVIIDTDLGGDPDDIQSLVRAIHYSDVLDIQGIVSTEGNGAADPDLIREWIMRTDVDHLREEMGYTDLMSEADLLAAVKTGTRDRLGPGAGRSTEGSAHIVERALAASPGDPLWILAWGSLGTVAQALFDDPSIVANIRLYSIGDFNSTSNLDARDAVLDTLEQHPDFWWVENGVLPRQSHSTFRGVWEGGNQSGQWNRVTFLERNIRGHGTRSDGRFDQMLGDAFPVAESPREAIGSLKEGDSPSLLYLLSPVFAGFGDLDDPTTRSWGGKFRQADSRFPNYYVDIDCDDVADCKATINQHRVAYLTHWRDRWDRYDVPNDGSIG